MFKRLLTRHPASLALLLAAALSAGPAETHMAQGREVTNLRAAVRGLRQEVRRAEVRREQAHKDLEAAREDAASLGGQVARLREKTERLESHLWAAIAGLVLVLLLALIELAALLFRPRVWEPVPAAASPDPALRDGLRSIEARMRALETLETLGTEGAERS